MPEAKITKRQQVAAQCDAVVMLATELARAHSDYAQLLQSEHGDQILDIVGQRTAVLMEMLGDILYEMDAQGPHTDVLAPIYERAHKMFPCGA